MGSGAYSDCTSVSAACPVEQTIYGYYPSLPANAFFCAFFALFMLVNTFITIRYRLWVFGSLVVLGCAGEMAGYIGRIMMHSNPWSNSGFELQICTLIFSPSFWAAALYLTLKDLSRSIGPHFSPLRPTLYPWLFISFDIFSLVLQAVGGGIAASANTSSGSAAGGHIMLAGIVFQVVTFTVLYVLIAQFWMRMRRAGLTGQALQLVRSRDFRIFVGGMGGASLAIYVRCVYRIAELAGGWANSIQRDEGSYIVLDGVMCCIAIIFITVCHPAFFFKTMLVKGKGAQVDEKLASDTEVAV